jgi:ABC-2 type transport system permease protein
MLLSLVKKDFILIKKYVPLYVLMAFAIPLYVTAQVKGNGGFLAFILTVLFLEYLAFNTVSVIEEKNRGAALLCTTPYTRKALVQAKYLFVLTIFICSYLIYSFLALVDPLLESLDILSLGLSLLALSLFFAVMIPVQYQFGYIKTRYLFFFLIFITPFVFPGILKTLQAIPFQPSTLLPPIMVNLLPWFLALVIGITSMTFSMQIYAKKNL